MKTLMEFVAIFLCLCLMGLFVCLAGGVHWATPVAGLMAAVVIVAALIVTGVYISRR